MFCIHDAFTPLGMYMGRPIMTVKNHIQQKYQEQLHVLPVGDGDIMLNPQQTFHNQHYKGEISYYHNTLLWYLPTVFLV